jgi:phage baseplate assembly protein gpV
VSAVESQTKKSLPKNSPGARSSDAPDGKMFTLDRAKARRWLVEMIAARASVRADACNTDHA